MEKILIVEDGVPRLLRDELELIPEFAALFTRKYNSSVEGDMDGRKRLRAQKELVYLWFTYSLSSPFKEYSDDERRSEALACAELPTTFRESPELRAAIDKYLSINESRVLKLIRSANKVIDKLRGFFEAVDFTQKAENGQLIYKPSEVMKAIIDLDKVAVGLEKLEQREKNEVKEGSTNRGAQEDGWIMESTNGNTKRDSTNSEPEEDSDL